MTGPMGSGLPQFGLPRRLAIVGFALPLDRKVLTNYDLHLWIPKNCLWFQYLKNKLESTSPLGSKARCKTIHCRRLSSHLQRLLSSRSRFFFVFSLHPAQTWRLSLEFPTAEALITIPSPPLCNSALFTSDHPPSVLAQAFLYDGVP